LCPLRTTPQASGSDRYCRCAVAVDRRADDPRPVLRCQSNDGVLVDLMASLLASLDVDEELLEASR